jgi:3-methyl-2-oxobutanoate hydroxymethyltransferase
MQEVQEGDKRIDGTVLVLDERTASFNDIGSLQKADLRCCRCMSADAGQSMEPIREVTMRNTVRQIRGMKQRGERISFTSVYDYSMAKLADQAGIHMILVGDSVGNVMLGYRSTAPVTIEDILHHTRAVVAGTERALVVADMPFMSFHTESDAIHNAARCVREGGAQAVKMEGEGEHVVDMVRRVVRCGIAVMGHIGLTDQKFSLGGFEVQGRTVATARQLVRDAAALEEAGVFAIVLECIPTPLAGLITDRATIPVIGMGSGPCDGQVQIVHDLVGLYPDYSPKHSKVYANLGDTFKKAVSEWIAEVQSGAFPTEKQGYHTEVDDRIVAELLAEK